MACTPIRRCRSFSNQLFQTVRSAQILLSTGTSADISIAKTVDNANPAAGGTVTYTLTVTDLGPGTSTIVNAQDELPSGLSIVSATTSQGTYVDGGTLNWTIGTLPERNGNVHHCDRRWLEYGGPDDRKR